MAFKPFDSDCCLLLHYIFLSFLYLECIPWKFHNMTSNNDTGEESDRTVAKEVTLEKHIEPHVRIITLSLLRVFNLVNGLLIYNNCQCSP